MTNSEKQAEQCLLDFTLELLKINQQRSEQ